MADISLDDLIKKDKDERKVNRTNNVHNVPSQKFKPKTAKFDQKFNNNGENRNTQKFAKGKEEHRPLKRKFIKKQHQDNRPKRDEREQRQSKPQNNPKHDRKQRKEEEEPRQPRTLKVVGLSPEFTNEDLYKLFATEGALEKCLIEQDNFGRTLLTAIVKYHSPESAKSAIQNLNRHKIMNCVLGVSPYKNVKRND